MRKEALAVSREHIQGFFNKPLRGPLQAREGPCEGAARCALGVTPGVGQAREIP